MILPDNFDLSPEAAKMLERLRDLAIRYQTICQQAPHIWDGETVEDARLAKMGCNGEVAVRKGVKKTAPCPIRNLCLQTAIATSSNHGVWGGMTAHERRTIRRR